jgi:hypothetical protein
MDASEVTVSWIRSKSVILRLVQVIEFLVSFTLYESLHPRKLGFGVGEVPVQLRVSITIDAVLGRSVRLAFIGVIKPAGSQ